MPHSASSRSHRPEHPGAGQPLRAARRQPAPDRAALDVSDRPPRRDVHAGGAAPQAQHAATRSVASTRTRDEPLTVDDIQLGLVEIVRRIARTTPRRRRRAPTAPALAHAPRRPARPHAEPGRSTCENILDARHHVRHRPGRHRQDLPRRRLRGRRARARRGEAHRPRRGPRSRPASGSASCPATSRRRSTRTCARSTTRSTT